MNKLLFVVTLLTANAALGQVGYRSVQNDTPVKKAYDSTVNLGGIGCEFDPASVIGQEIYFAQRSPYFKDAKYLEDTTLKGFISEKQTTFPGVSNGMSGEKKRGGDFQSNLYKPIYIQHPFAEESVTPYSALENKTFTIIGWENLKEGNGTCESQVTLKDPDGEKVKWVVYGRHDSNDFAFTKGYLEKLKQTWVNKPVYFIEDIYAPFSFYNPLDKQTLDYVKGSKWQCTDLTFLFDEGQFGKLHLILRNDDRKEIAVQIQDRNSSERQLSLKYIRSEEKYLAIKQEEQRVRDSLLVKEKAHDMQNKKDLKARQQSMIKQFGATNGNLIANGKVKMGMNRVMCEAAWGTPDKVVKSQVGPNVIETWFYYADSSWLKFRDGKLIQIME